MPRAAALALAVLAACSPTETADKVGRRAVETVVLPVVSRNLPGDAAQAATRCVIDHATAAEVQALARDIAVEAGTSTVQTVATIAARPETLACLAAAGLSPLVL